MRVKRGSRNSSERQANAASSSGFGQVERRMTLLVVQAHAAQT